MSKAVPSESFLNALMVALQTPEKLALLALGAVAAFFVISFLLKKAPKQKKTLRKDEFVALTLAKKIIVSPDTRIFRFALPTEEHILGLPIGQHVMVQATVKGSDVQRPYTPISSDDDKGYIDLLVKVYRAGVHPKFPEGGVMSQHMDTLKEGVDTLKFRGPTGRFEYLGRGKVQWKTQEQHVKQFVMIGGGTGITPLLQVIRAILKDKDDQTLVSLLFANQTEEDILLRQELDQCAKDPRCKVWYTLDRPPADWKYSSGFITQDMIADNLAAPTPDTLVLMCGPPPMITFACKPNLEKLGYNANQFVVF